MACVHIERLTLQPPSPNRSVYREDCTQCFDSIDDLAGLDVCLQCFNGGCAGDRNHAQEHYRQKDHPLVLNIRRTRKVVDRDEPPMKMSKLAIAAETDADRYDVALTVKCLDCKRDDLNKEDSKLAPVVQGIMKAKTFSRKEEVKAWEQELTSCEHILLLQQDEARKIDSQQLGHCSNCDLRENLWLCLQCGNLGCGRAQFGGVGGNSHALAHTKESNHGVAVKLGSITPEGTADVYCYTCDDERIDENLATHLANWGIMLADRQKTEKSLTEMQIEQNLRWDFSMTTDDGKEFTPSFGPGLTGLKNLGNSCYISSIIQCLYDVPAFQERYFRPSDPLPEAQDPAEDLETQLRKIGDGLLSGRYSKPDPGQNASDGVPHQKGISPSMFKHLIGRNHPEFSTMRQQDAFEFLQHLLQLVTRAHKSNPAEDPTKSFRFAMEERLQCLSCKKVRYMTVEQDSLFLDVPIEQLPAVGDEPPKYRPVSLKECLDNLTTNEVVELTCASCGSKDGYTKRSLFKTFPEVLVLNVRKMTTLNWVPIKVDVPVIVDDEPFLMDSYMSSGQQPDEELLPEEATSSSSAPAFVPNAEALASLEAMGFPRVRCEKALHATGNADPNAAMEWLFAHMEDADIDTPIDFSAGATSISAELVDTLGAMGFTAAQARKALKETGSNMERAVEWLFNHPEDQGDLSEDTGDAPALQGDQVTAGSDKLPAQFRLQSIVCHKGTSIHAGHYVAFIRKTIDGEPSWVLFNDEKVVKSYDVEEMKKFAYVYFFKRT